MAMKTSRTEDLDRNPCNYSRVIFNKGAQNMHWKKRQLLQQMLLGKLDFHLQKTETRFPVSHLILALI
jgi:hypothetical protein